MDRRGAAPGHGRFPVRLRKGRGANNTNRALLLSNRKDFRVRDVVAAYERAASDLIPQYERRSFEEVHALVLKLLPDAAGNVLDVGAGSGRDAAWFAARGHSVVAVEPSSRMRKKARLRHGDSKVYWMDDRLPTVDKVLRSRSSFDLIWLSAVWHHIPRGQRPRAFRKLVSLLNPGGSMMISLRQGPPTAGRPMQEAGAAEIEKLARQHGLNTTLVQRQDDAGKRPGIYWKVVWLQLPDDGTGALPLLRHVVINDQKSSTYKLALLRILLRIADSAAGFARESADENYVELPLGLVALYWVRSFRPLVDQDLPQQPVGNGQLAFAKAGFRGLSRRSPFDLRVGQRFHGQDAENLTLAIRDAAKCIRKMPAHFITFPGSDRQVFPCDYTGPVRKRVAVRLDEAFLWSVGSISVPIHLWRAMSRFASWLEPAVLNEWVRMMRAYESQKEGMPRSWDRHRGALQWLEPKRDTKIVRKRAQQLRDKQPLFCIWTEKPLTTSFEIDHCFPFAAWPCNDLWNLLPSQKKTNNEKRGKLPSYEALEQAKPRLFDWWDSAYLRDKVLSERFEHEARGALPLAVSDNGKVTPESLFEGVALQQRFLKQNQQLAEWQPKSTR